MTEQETAEIGVIGGSGFYAFLDDAVEVPMQTPYGPPSDNPVIGTVAGRRVAFLARHGRDHRFPPHRIPYRANLWALRSLGVRQVLGPCAVGGLRPDLGPGTLVVPDQLVDRTTRRISSYVDEGATHLPFADPYCPRGREVAIAATRGAGKEVADSGTLVVINGPRFSSKAESAWHQAAGWSIVGMTAMPEAAIARELAMCFTSVALVTDHDAGVEGGEAVTHAEVLEQFARNIEGMKSLMRRALGAMPAPETDDAATCACRRALDGIELPFTLPG